MNETSDICSLEYLAGTLATAYKGAITSLIAKDFCITEADGKVTLKGAILAMPEGDYQAFLMQEGLELSRGDLRQGRFELRTDSETLRRARNLQIDIIQKGRHIGTFLLRQEHAGGMYISALELSEDIRGINFRELAEYLSDKPGLLKKAEEIISRALSPKKDWGSFSERINSFAKDLFWSDRAAFYRWFEVLSEYSRKAALTAEGRSENKLIENLLSLISLPLENESDEGQLKNLVDVWLRKIGGRAIPFAFAFHEVSGVLAGIHTRFPDASVDTLLRALLASLREQAVNVPMISMQTLGQLRGVSAKGDIGRLLRYSEEQKKNFLTHLETLEGLLDEKDLAGVLGKMAAEDIAFLDDSGMTDAFFEVLLRDIREETSEVLVAALIGFFPVFGSLSAEAYRGGLLNTAGFIRALAVSGAVAACSLLLRDLGKAGLKVMEDVLLREETAASILQSGSRELLEQYKTLLGQILVPAPEVAGFSSETWAEMVPDEHLERLTRFMAIIRLDSRFREVLVHLICNLYAVGVFLPDDRLFQREVSSYLNSGRLQENFLLHYLLLRKLPVFYNEVGASGRIREFTTEIDAWGNDTVLYFLRKQVHVNASNYNIALVETIIRAWLNQDLEILRGSVPEEILGRMNTALLKRYSPAIKSFFTALGLYEKNGPDLEKIHAFTEDDLKEAIGKVDAEDEILRKIHLLIMIYREIFKKYSLTAADIFAGEPAKAGAPRLLKEQVPRMKSLYETVVSPEKTEAQEAFYFKRHIAFGIPSVMGSYHEPKFDALAAMISTGETIRLIIENIAVSIEDTSGAFSDADLMECASSLECIRDLFDIYGLGNFQVDEIVTVLGTNRLFLSQTVDLLRIWQRELSGMVETLSLTFHGPFAGLLSLLKRKEDSPRKERISTHGGGGFSGRSADVYLRDIMSSVAGFGELDRLLEGLIMRLRLQMESEGDHPVLSGGALQAGGDFFMLDRLSIRDALALSPLIGGKAKGLVILMQQGLPVPHGVVFPASKARDYREFSEAEGFTALLKSAVNRIEERTGTKFGDPEEPLLLSVRSGSYISMPGVLSTVLFCGMNEETLGGLVRTKGRWTAFDSYRRFIEDFGTVVCGLERGYFDDLAAGHRGGWGKPEAVPDAEWMESLVGLYLRALADDGITIPGDVYEQLRQAVRAIYGSWHAPRARQFRDATRVSEHWGTSVLIMEMLCGNDRNSGASVFFTRDPLTMGPGIFGETRENAAGTDLVEGRLVNRPLARRQETGGLRSLEETWPDLFFAHEELAVRIEKGMKGLPQEVEAVYTPGMDGKPVLHVLQTKRMEIYRGYTKRFGDVCGMHRHIIGRGVGVHGGALSGVVTFASGPEEVRKAKEASGLPVVLLRETANTDDVALMPEVDGIITSAGGVSSHAAVLAQKFGLTAVIGCTDMKITGSGTKNTVAVIGGHTFEEGAVISLDGSTGLVYSGSCGSFL